MKLMFILLTIVVVGVVVVVVVVLFLLYNRINQLINSKEQYVKRQSVVVKFKQSL